MRLPVRLIICALLTVALCLGETAFAGKKRNNSNKRKGGKRGQSQSRVITSKHTGVVKRMGSRDLSAEHAAAVQGARSNAEALAPVNGAALIELMKAAKAKREAESGKATGVTFSK